MLSCVIYEIEGILELVNSNFDKSLTNYTTINTTNISTTTTNTTNIFTTNIAITTIRDNYIKNNLNVVPVVRIFGRTLVTKETICIYIYNVN